MVVREFEENGRIYRALERGDGAWQMTRTSNNPGEPPFLFCDHAHPTLAEAEACRSCGVNELAHVHEEVLVQIGHEDYPVMAAHQSALDWLCEMRLVLIVPDGTPVLSDRGRAVADRLLLD